MNIDSGYILWLFIVIIPLCLEVWIFINLNRKLNRTVKFVDILIDKNNPFKLLYILCLLSIPLFIAETFIIFITTIKRPSLSGLICIIFPILIFIPSIIKQFLKYYSTKFSWSKILNLILDCIFSVLFIIYMLYVILFGVNIYLSGYTERHIPLFLYTTELKQLKNKIGSEKIAYFPKTIPKNTANFEFYIDDAWDGNLYYVKYKTDKNSIEKVFKENANKCIEISRDDENYPSVYINDISYESKSCFFTIKNSVTPYTTGIIWDKKVNTLYYYYSN